jgi:hypothetical protein
MVLRVGWTRTVRYGDRDVVCARKVGLLASLRRRRRCFRRRAISPGMIVGGFRRG